MQLARCAYGLDPRTFGRRGACAAVAQATTSTLSDDFRLFALTFAAGFLFVSILIG